MTRWYAGLPLPVRIGLWILLAGWVGGGILWAATRDGARENGSRAAEASGSGPQLLLLSLRASAEDQPALALVHAGPSGASVMSIPAETVIEIPGRGPGTFTDALVEGGADDLATALANVLGIRVPPALVGDAAEVRGLVDAVGPVEVDVPADTEGFSAGTKSMDAATAIRFLGLEVSGETGLERVARQDALIRGIVSAAQQARLEALTRALDGFAGDARPPSAAGLMQRVAGRDDALFLSLPVDRSQAPRVTRYEVANEGLSSVKEALEDVRTVKSVRDRRVRLLAADAERATQAAAALIEGGYVIVLSARLREPRDETRIVMAERTEALEESARRLRDVVGGGRIAVYSQSQTVFDVTLELGRDWRPGE